MTILSASQLAAARQRNDAEIAKGTKGAHGYPSALVRDLLQTIDDLRAKKKRWQRVATHRGELLDKIKNLSGLAPNLPEN